MSQIETLLNKRWILKSEDKELYYKIRDELGEIRKFASEKLGCQILENSLLIKMEKIPVTPEIFMGITEFGSKEEYAFLCMVLMFLEEKDAQEQFILSQMTEYISAQMPGGADWTLYANRRKLIRVLRFAVKQGMILVTDGSDDVFMDSSQGEVLYENTGASRYFMRNFSNDIMGYTKPEEFGESEWYEMDEEKGIIRRHRVYKRLLFAPGMFRDDGGEEDFEYLKYYGRRLADDLEQNFDCSVQIHKGSAYFLMGENCRVGAGFPGNTILSDVMLLCCSCIREKITSGEWKVQKNEICTVEKIAFEQMLKGVRQEYAKGFSKTYREMPEGEFVETVLEELERWMFVKQDEKEQKILIYPLAGKIQGHYPKNFTGEENDEQ